MQKENPALIYGLIGYPVKHSLSPAMQNAAFHALNINAEYKLFEVKPEELEDFLSGKKEIKDAKGNSFFIRDLAGFNITMPHKVRAKEILERNFPRHSDKVQQLDTEYYVKFSGAINTVKMVNGIPYYYNTDASGFLRSLEKELKFDIKGKETLVIGCGGAGSTIIAALSWRNLKIKKIYIYDISDEAMKSAEKHFLEDIPQASYLKDKLKFILKKEEIPQVITKCQLLVNASPVGMRKTDQPIIERSLLHEDLFVYDIVYIKDDETQLIKDADSRELKWADGKIMLLYQGMDAFEIWLNDEGECKIKAPIDVMRKALTEAPEKCSIK